MSASELRVHGVSGTAPRNTLYSDPELDSKSRLGPYAPVYRLPERDDVSVRAFHWGGLTAGTWRTALWILLGPFALANTAGWMSSRPTRRSHFAVRIAGLCITGAFTDLVITALIGIPERRIGELAAPWDDTARAVLAALLAVGIVTGVAEFPMRSHYGGPGFLGRLRLLFGITPRSQIRTVRAADVGHTDETMWADPAGANLLQDDPFLYQPILDRLTRVHVAVALSVLALNLSTPVGATAVMVLSTVVVIAGLAGVGLLTFAPAGWPARWWVTLLPHAAAIATVGSIVARTGLEPTDPTHSVTSVAAIALGLAIIATGAFAGRRSMGAMVLAAQFGAVLGIILAMIVEALLALEPQIITAGAGWVAVAMLFVLSIIAAVAFMLMLVSSDPPGSGTTIKLDRAGARGVEDGTKRAMLLMRRAEQRAGLILTSAAMYGALLLAALTWLAANQVLTTGVLAFDLAPLGSPDDHELLGLVASVTAFGLLACVIVFVWVCWGPVRAALASLAAVLLVVAIESGYISLNVFGVRAATDGSLLSLAVIIAVLIPGSFLLRSIVVGVRPGTEGSERRRRVGILWDLTTFWPRWYHPLGPPAYGPFVVEALIWSSVCQGAD